jgi:sulfite oxidase
MQTSQQQSEFIDRRGFVQTAGLLSVAGMTGQSVFNAQAAEGRKDAEDSASKLIVHGKFPMNAEPHLSDLVESWLTPVEHFYIRSHAPVPKIDVKKFRLSIEGLVDKPFEISLDELAQEFKQASTIATMCCAGNRRIEHHHVKPVKGVLWKEGPLGNAKWGGVKLSDLLKKAGLRENAKHVWFEGSDIMRRGSVTYPFGASIPIEKALLDTDSTPGALVVTHMNDKPLEPDHGYPLRTVVPGYIGARSVKWLGKIVVSDRPSPNHYVATAYKLVEDGDDLEWAEKGPIYRLPINSAICTPSHDATVKAGTVRVTGYALPPGRAATTIAKVEISTNGGRSWIKAKLTSPAREYCWQLWSAEVSATAATKQLIVRATDSNGKTQPQRVDWNAKGYMFNAWHSVGVNVKS